MEGKTIEGTTPPKALDVLDTRGRYGAAVAGLSLGVGVVAKDQGENRFGVRDTPWTIRRL